MPTATSARSSLRRWCRACGRAGTRTRSSATRTSGVFFDPDEAAQALNHARASHFSGSRAAECRPFSAGPAGTGTGGRVRHRPRMWPRGWRRVVFTAQTTFEQARENSMADVMRSTPAFTGAPGGGGLRVYAGPVPRGGWDPGRGGGQVRPASIADPPGCGAVGARASTIGVPILSRVCRWMAQCRTCRSPTARAAGRRCCWRRRDGTTSRLRQLYAN